MIDKGPRADNLLRELVATFIVAEANPNPLITITQVSTSPDHKNAVVYFTTIPENREQDALVFLQRSATELREYIKKKSGLRFIPNFRFEVDSGERARQHIIEKLDQL